MSAVYEPTNAELLTAIKGVQSTLDARPTAVGSAPTPFAGPVPQLTGDRPTDKPFNVTPAVVPMAPIAEMSDMVLSLEKDWEKLGPRSVFTLKTNLNNILRNWEMNGGVGTPEFVRDQLQGLAVAYTNMWIDTGTGVDVKAVITSLVDHYTRWQKGA